MSSISVLGCGWLGLPLAQRFLREGYVVKGSVRTKEKGDALLSLGVSPFLIDIDDPAECDSAFFDSDVLVIAIPSKNREGFHRLLNNITHSSVKHVIFVSSTSVYYDNNGTITEKCDVNSDSALVKIESELKESASFTTTVLRFSGLVGYYRNPGRFFQKSGRSVSNPDAPVNMIHQDDCIELLLRIIQQQKWNETYNACADTHPSKRVFYTQATQAIGIDPPTFIESATQTFKVISNEKIKAALGYEFIYPDVMDITYN